MNKVKKTLAGFIVIAVLAMSFIAIQASAVTLDQSFSGGTSQVGTGVNTLTQTVTYTKTCWAKTVGYSGYHYVRAYIGGTSADPAGAVADTGRCYSQGDIYKQCSTSRTCSSGAVSPLLFPTGYAKYGTT